MTPRIEELKRQLADLEGKKRQTKTLLTRRQKIEDRIRDLEKQQSDQERHRRLLLVTLVAA